MKAKKLPSGNWRVQIMIDGKRVSVTAPTEDEAIYEAIMLKTGKKEAKNTSPTIGKCIDDYIVSKRNIQFPSPPPDGHLAIYGLLAVYRLFFIFRYVKFNTNHVIFNTVHSIFHTTTAHGIAHGHLSNIIILLLSY